MADRTGSPAIGAHRTPARVVIIRLLSAAMVISLLGLFFWMRSGHGSLISELTAPAVLTQVKKLNQLVTVKYSVQRVIGLKEAREPLGEESILLMVEGQVLAGVDLNDLKDSDCTISGKRSITLRLPPARIVDVSLNERNTKVWDRHVTWWTPWVAPDPELEHRARLSAIDDVRSAALSMGILNDAQKNAQNSIEELLTLMNVEHSSVDTR
jgi:Protein of unknown function (DUF4230)